MRCVSNNALLWQARWRDEGEWFLGFDTVWMLKQCLVALPSERGVCVCVLARSGKLCTLRNEFADPK